MNRLAFSVILTALFCTCGIAEQGEKSPVYARDESTPLMTEAVGGAFTTSTTIGHPTFMSPHASPIAVNGAYVFVVNTPADTVDVIDTDTHIVIRRVNVGIDPVSIGVRPDGKEVWVSNHVSDSISVINTNPASPTWLQVIATVQAFDPETRTTRFDEPMGIAFASNEKAYVALSSANQVAVINVATREVSKRLTITAQDPRALTVRGDRLYVIPFESNNQTQLSGGTSPIDGKLTTFDARKHVMESNNSLLMGAVVDIVRHPKVPDRDLYIFDTQTDELVTVVDTLGTLLYGIAVDSKGRVFITQTDARNYANGLAGTKNHGLAELENRPYLNRITSVGFNANSAEAPAFIDLEPLPPAHPAPGEALATPFGIQISDDDATLVVSAAGSDTLFTVDTLTGEVLGRISVGAVPRGIALESDAAGNPSRAWVFNAVANTVTLVNLSDLTDLKVIANIPMHDPTHIGTKRGRIAFNDADVSTTGTFSCASCHPDGHTDQLLWVLDTPIVTGTSQIMPRTTMPVRGLRDTEPYHWDGTLGDPYGGNNSANIHRTVPPNSIRGDPESSVRHLIDRTLATTMSAVDLEVVNDEGKRGALTGAARDDLAKFLLSVLYPPAQGRAYTNILSSEAAKGFKLFHIDGDLQGKPQPNVCGDCHRMPFWVSTNTPATGRDAPTWRGAYDRWRLFPPGMLNLIDFDVYRDAAELGVPERDMWKRSWRGRKRFDPVWNMVLEGSTGFSGVFARQVTLNAVSAETSSTNDLLNALERAASEGGIVLQGEGVFINEGNAIPVAFEFTDGIYGVVDSECKSLASMIEQREQSAGDFSKDATTFTRAALVSLAADGYFVGTFTARHGAKVGIDNPQPAIWTLGPIQIQRGRQEFPMLHPGDTTMTISGRHILNGAHLIVNGRRVPGTITAQQGAFFDRDITIELETLPPEGMHFLQIQNPDGMFSNDFIFHVTREDTNGSSRTSSTKSTNGVDFLKRVLKRLQTAPK
ncbi:MAG: hypothetical protein OYL97_10820 [Candidatus Poribacteria bacterium]|nr:hypothetical protein [Candidatus Poribacteria bacterium]MDE0467540.1 hypothetical protein [Candidatus Poribacteria bacterium]